jgi:7-cyano-7-deazaguanine synthase
MVVVVVVVAVGTTAVVAMAVAAGHRCHALSFRYGQRHGAELEAAIRIAKQFHVEAHRIVDLDLSGIGGSALTDRNIDVPEAPGEGIPVTYVPARNTVFLSVALAWAEVLEATDIYIGVNAVDFSGYPDCRPGFIEAFETMANLATKAGVEGQSIHIHAPLIHLSKADIIRRGIELGLDYRDTVSCYQADAKGRACGKCDACRLRREGFEAAGVVDATRYTTEPG